MSDAILNITTTGVNQWIQLGAGNGFPHKAYSVTIQVRNDQTDAYYRMHDQPLTYMTIKNGGSVSMEGLYQDGEIDVAAANGVVLEIQIGTGTYSVR